MCRYRYLKTMFFLRLPTVNAFTCPTSFFPMLLLIRKKIPAMQKKALSKIHPDFGACPAGNNVKNRIQVYRNKDRRSEKDNYPRTFFC
jgi:hypothetical protein